MSNEVKDENVKVDESGAEKKKEPFFTEVRIEIITAVFLGITALLTAWAGWIGSLHGGNMSTNYTQSNNLSALGNSEWNLAAQNYMQDTMLYNDITALRIDLAFAEDKGDADEIDRLEWKLDQLLNDSCTDELYEAILWADEMSEETGESYTPFDKEGFVDNYFETANEYLVESDELLEEGKRDNSYGDTYNLVTVIYSISLFLLGVVGVFKHVPNRAVVLAIAIVAFVIATIFMLTIPMPTGFSLASYFK